MSLFRCIFLTVVRTWLCMRSDMFELSAGWTWRKRVIIPFTKNSIRYREKSRIIIYIYIMIIIYIYVGRILTEYYLSSLFELSNSTSWVVYYFYAWRIWMVRTRRDRSAIAREIGGGRKKAAFFTAMRGKNVEPFFDNSLIRKGPLTYNQRTCRTIRGSCHCPCLCRCRPLSTSAS